MSVLFLLSCHIHTYIYTHIRIFVWVFFAFYIFALQHKVLVVKIINLKLLQSAVFQLQLKAQKFVWLVLKIKLALPAEAFSKLSISITIKHILLLIKQRPGSDGYCNEEHDKKTPNIIPFMILIKKISL